MGYVKTGLGADRSGFMLDLKRDVKEKISPEQAERRAFLASMPTCRAMRANGELAFEGWIYTYKDGKKACVRDPLKIRELESEGNLATSSMPLFGSGTAINGIRDGYLNTLLKAQGDAAGRAAATSMGVQWDLTDFGFKESFNTEKPPLKLAPKELLTGRNFISAEFYLAGFTDAMVEDAKSNPDQERNIRSTLAVSAHNYASYALSEQRAGGSKSEHRASFCDLLGLPPQYADCCKAALASGIGLEEYKELLEKNDPRVTGCFAMKDAESAAQTQRKLVLVAGGVAAVLVGATLLKKVVGKKK